MKKMKPSALRTLVTLGVMVVVAIGYFTLVGIGNLSAPGVDVWSFICPLGYLESLLAGHTFLPRAFISFVAVVLLVILVGRAFCAWLCPMPMFQRWFPGIGAKKRAADEAHDDDATDRADATAMAQAARKGEPLRPGKPNRFRFDSRFGVLLGALASAAIFGFPVFCLVCPVGLTFATVFLVMRLFAYGDTTWTIIVLPAVLLIEVLFMRKWCSKICPLGALMSLISGANRTLRPSIDDDTCRVTKDGDACFACSKVCPEELDIRRPDKSPASLNNCTKCRECASACPVHAITFPLLDGKKRAKANVGDESE